MTSNINSGDAVGSDHGASAVYRSVRPLPYELRDRCVMYLEEGLYTQALILLSNLLVAGQSLPTPIPAIVPSPATLGLLSTLVVHPEMTTHTKFQDNIIASNQALVYLRHVLKIIGPVNAQLSTAFAYTDPRLRKRRISRMHNGGSGGDEEEEEDPMFDEENAFDNELATKEALWVLADDLWHTVGWAFTCTVRYPARWERWKLYLEFVLDALDADFNERLRLVDMEMEATDTRRGSSLLRESLIMQYLAKATHQDRFGRTRVLRAIFATGNAGGTHEFPEIFLNETKPPPKPKEHARSNRKKVNLEEDEFGDYFDGDGDPDEKENTNVRIKEEPGSRTSSRGPWPATRTPSVGDKEKASADVDPVDAYGGIESLELRRRFLLLLMRVATAIPEEFTTADEICDLTAETLRKLPLPVFAYFILPSSSHPWPTLCHAALLKFLFKPLLTVDPPRIVDQTFMERQYLPLAAASKTSVANAKVSIALESLLRLLRKYGLLQYTEELERTVSQGIEARTTATRKYDHSNPEEIDAEKWLALSATRLKLFVKMSKSK